MANRSLRKKHKRESKKALMPCIFCGHFRRLTREHIWGEWIRKYVPSQLSGGHILRDVELGQSFTPEKVTFVKRSGNPLDVHRRVVCASCNNVWMSRVQDRAKQFLIPLFNGDRISLSKEAQIAIAAWATMVTMTAEYMLDSGSKIAVSREERAAFMNSESPLPDWRVWIGYYPGGIWAHQWEHTSVPIVGGEELPSAEKVYTPLPNTQTTTFVVGKLYVHTMSSSYPDITTNWRWLNNTRLQSLLIPIFPSDLQFIAWPVHRVSEGDVKLSSEMFIRWVEEIAAQTGF